MAEAEFEALLGTPGPIDPADAGRLYGLTVESPTSPEELETALGAKTRMIVVRADRRRNLELHRELVEAAESALASA